VKRRRTRAAELLGIQNNKIVSVVLTKWRLSLFGQICIAADEISRIDLRIKSITLEPDNHE
jgi:hypothetical protein